MSHTQPVDGRKGPDSLMTIVRDVFGEDPLGGHLFVFFSKRCDRVRIVYWDRNGFAMWTKRLEAGRFRPSFSSDGRLAPVRIEEILAVAAEAEGKLRRIVRRVLERLDQIE